MDIYSIILLLGFVIMGAVVIWVSIEKQWSTLITVFSVFATAVTGMYVYTKLPPIVTNISSISTPTNISTTAGK